MRTTEYDAFGTWDFEPKGYYKRLGIIESTFLGNEMDHGFFMAQLTFNFGGAVQAAQIIFGKDDTHGVEFIKKVLDACGASTWESLKGKKAMALYEDDTYNNYIRGIAPMPYGEGKPIVFSEIWSENK